MRRISSLLSIFVLVFGFLFGISKSGEAFYDRFYEFEIFDVQGITLRRKWSDCIEQRDGFQCLESINLGFYPIEERIVLYNTSGVWVVAEIDPLVRVTELYNPPIPLFTHDLTATYQGTVQILDVYGDYIGQTHWSADVFQRAKDTIYIENVGFVSATRREVYIRFLDRRLIHINFWLDEFGRLIKMTRERIVDDVVIENTVWLAKLLT